MGEWPQMSIKERIVCIEQFVWRIRPQEKIFALLEMWEIARPYTSCLDEFQRTLKYIEDTITALREMEKEGRSIERIGEYIYSGTSISPGGMFVYGPFNYPLN